VFEAGLAAQRVLLGKGGSTLVDLLVETPELRIAVTGPGMLFARLEFATTLSALDGCTVRRLQALAGSLSGTIHCGLIGSQPAEIAVEGRRTGGVLWIGLGPASMYESELVLATKTGETFAALIRRLLATAAPGPFLAALYPVTATGHLEHHHEGSETGEHHAPSGHGEGHHGHP
jgi:hypothetical protein